MVGGQIVLIAGDMIIENGPQLSEINWGSDERVIKLAWVIRVVHSELLESDLGIWFNLNDNDVINYMRTLFKL